MHFIDLFAGLGGFHLALANLDHKCVFASEIDPTLQETYYQNFGMRPSGDIRQIDAKDIPKHDILCAGFPCQPFSKARDHSGPGDPELSELYLQILKVIRHHHPKYLILENVPNFQKHEDGQTWEVVESFLREEGYFVRLEKLSPHEFGIPQIRQRVYIVGSLSPLAGFQWPEKTKSDVSVDAVLDTNPTEARLVPAQVERCLDVWQEFLDLVPIHQKIPHPLWSMEFGATYCFERTTPWATDPGALRGYRGSHGAPLDQARTKEDILALLPSHARTKQTRFPDWKTGFIRKNREFYQEHNAWVDRWMEKIKQFPSSFQKLEWNCQEKDPSHEVRRIREYLIQIRASGVRVKRKTTAPSLVAMTATQVPIVGWENRYMTPQECQRLQSMEALLLPPQATKAYAALGNAINVQVAQLVVAALLSTDERPVSDTPSSSHCPTRLESSQPDLWNSDSPGCPLDATPRTISVC
jgi:DNA (cytosine-5)-methyltransferase 1